MPFYTNALKQTWIYTDMTFYTTAKVQDSRAYVLGAFTVFSSNVQLSVYSKVPNKRTPYVY